MESGRWWTFQSSGRAPWPHAWDRWFRALCRRSGSGTTRAWASRNSSALVPGGREYTDGKYNANGDIPENILDYLHWSGTFRPEAVTLTPRASVEYLPYAPPATSFYFGQFAMMHACWYMQRYAYDFVLYVDTDEYVWLESSVMGRPKPLLAWLGTVPAKAATVTLHRFTYPPACQPSGAHAPMVERAVVRQEDAHQHSKMLVRPRDLLLATNHVPVDVRDGFEESYDAVDEVRLKHIRDENFRYPGIFDCTDARLVQDPPPTGERCSILPLGGDGIMVELHFAEVGKPRSR